GAPRLRGVEVRTDEAIETRTADVYVVTTPLDRTRELIDGDLLAADPDLGSIQRLRVAPMAALHVELVERRPDLPREHVFLSGGLYGLSFIDNTSHWPMSATSILSFIASDFTPLQNLTEQEQYTALMTEIGRYLPIGLGDVRAWQLNPNTDKGLRLFINTAGSWPDRPDPSSKVENLFFAGDWVKNRIDL